MKTFNSKNVYCPRSQISRVLLSTLASFELFDVLRCIHSPDNGVSLVVPGWSRGDFGVLRGSRGSQRLKEVSRGPEGSG